MNFLRLLSRWVLGLVFIFSGFVKGVDPLGTAFRIEDYLVAYGLDWLLPIALVASVLLCALEFALGVFMILNVKPKLTVWPVLLLMTFFTIVTFYDAIYEPVPNCGCFGDAIVLSNWATFYKNIVLMIPTVFLFVQRKKLKSLFSVAGDYIALVTVPTLFILFSVFNYRHLPMIDFLNWKVGNKMIADKEQPVHFYLTFKNKLSGETKEYLSPDYPYNDTIWMQEWEFLSQCVVDPNPRPEHNLQIFDNQANDLTDVFLANPQYQFLCIIWKPDDVSEKAMLEMNAFYHKAESDGHSFVALVSDPEEGKRLAQQLHLDFEFFLADHVELKMMVRSNPGLMLLHNGIVIDKWSHRNFPAYDDLQPLLNDHP